MSKFREEPDCSGGNEVSSWKFEIEKVKSTIPDGKEIQETK
jgi:hypothetical protein